MEEILQVRDNEGKWLQSDVFRTVGKFYTENGYYIDEPDNSNDWREFWTNERTKCLSPVKIGNATITGDHYHYLNYCPIQKVDEDSIVGTQAKKKTDFPDFWDGDYDYFWVREIARNGILGALNLSIDYIREVYEMPEKEKLVIYMRHLDELKLRVKPVLTCSNLEGGKDIIVGKARRRGFSLKNASVGVVTLAHRLNLYTLLMAYEKKYLFPGKKTLFYKVMQYVNFINEHTGWQIPSDYTGNNHHIRSSYKEYVNGRPVEKGLLSEIEAVSFKDNPDAGRGADTYDTIGEEVGAWGVPGGLKATLNAMKASSDAGGFKTGMTTLFGTSGDIEGGTADFADLFNRPGANNFMEFHDIYGENQNKIEGFFFPKQVNTEGFYDEQGNSNMEAATQYELDYRQRMIDKGATANEILSRMQEEPLNSSEAFSMVSQNTFPVVELNRQLDNVKINDLQRLRGTAVDLYREKGKVHASPILDNSKRPITTYNDIPEHPIGCPVIYEYPVENAPRGLYKIGYDPIRQDKGTSLAGIIVYKSHHKGSWSRDIIVAEYIGRLNMPDDIDRVAELFADFYNTTIMHENEVTGVKNFFRRIKRLNLLALQPDAVISKNVKNSTVSRVYGCHMTDGLKDAGERYINTWLLAVVDYDEEGNPVRNLDRIYSQRLLEELIRYNRKGNFDLVSSLIMCMFQVQEEELGKEYSSNKKNMSAIQLMELKKSMYKK